MPDFQPAEIVVRTVQCARCERPGTYRLDLERGDFSFECSCTTLAVGRIHTAAGSVGEIRCVTEPGRMIGIRPSRRTLSRGPSGRLFREKWRTNGGVILQSGNDYVVVLTGENREQLWADSFERAYFELTGRPWQAPKEGL